MCKRSSYFWSLESMLDQIANSNRTVQSVWQKALEILDNNLIWINSIATDTCSTQQCAWKKIHTLPGLNHVFLVGCNSHSLQLVIKDLLDPGKDENRHIIQLDIWELVKLIVQIVVAHFGRGGKKHYEVQVVVECCAACDGSCDGELSNFASGTDSPTGFDWKSEEVRSWFSNKRNETKPRHKIPGSKASSVFCAHASFVFYCLHYLPHLRHWSYLHCASNWNFRFHRYRLSLSLFIFSSSVSTVTSMMHLHFLRWGGVFEGTLLVYRFLMLRIESIRDIGGEDDIDGGNEWLTNSRTGRRWVKILVRWPI